MKLLRRQFLHLAAGAAALPALSRIARAQTYPARPEAGLPGFHFSNWAGVWAPKGTPVTIIAKLNAAVERALADDNLRAQFAKLEVDISPPNQQSAAALGALQKAEIEKWWPIIKSAGIAPE